MLSCLVCDDHAMMRAALAGTVSLLWPDAEVATAADFNEARAAAAAQPDLILCDLAMPGASPVEGVCALIGAAPAAKLVVVTGNEDDQTLLDLFALDIAGFVPKSTSAEVVEAALRLAAAGGRYLPPRMIALAQARGASTAPVTSASTRLTERQREILAMLAEGRTNKEIARALGLSPATVKAHVAAVLAALDTANRTEAAFRARAMGLI